MELLIEGGLWQPHWQGALQAWRGQGHRWQLLQSKRTAHYPEGEVAPWAACPPDGILSTSALLAAWLDGDEAPCMGADPSQRILISASSALLILAKESGLLTLGPVGADLALNADDDLAAVLGRLLARRLVIPELRDSGASPAPGLVLRPLRPEDEADIVHYCADAAIARYTLNIPHPYPPEAARDWLALSGRKAALGLGWSWALTLTNDEEPAPLIGVISLHWSGELAWWVGVPWQNRGLATRAATLVRSFALEEAKLPALTARHMPDNLASGRVMAKLGMHYGGRSMGTDRYPGELSHWRLDRGLALPEQVLARLAPLLADPQVAVVILHGAWAQGEEGGALELALFMDNADVRSGRTRIAGVELVIRRHPFAWLARSDPWQESHCGGLLLKDRGESGLDYLRRLLGERQ